MIERARAGRMPVLFGACLASRDASIFTVAVTSPSRPFFRPDSVYINIIYLSACSSDWYHRFKLESHSYPRSFGHKLFGTIFRVDSSAWHSATFLGPRIVVQDSRKFSRIESALFWICFFSWYEFTILLYSVWIPWTMSRSLPRQFLTSYE